MVSVSAASRVTAGLLGSRLPQVRLIACRSSGYDNIDLAYARAHRIAVSNPRSWLQPGDRRRVSHRKRHRLPQHQMGQRQHPPHRRHPDVLAIARPQWADDVAATYLTLRLEIAERHSGVTLLDPQLPLLAPVAWHERTDPGAAVLAWMTRSHALTAKPTTALSWTPHAATLV